MKIKEQKYQPLDIEGASEFLEWSMSCRGDSTALIKAVSEISTGKTFLETSGESPPGPPQE